MIALGERLAAQRPTLPRHRPSAGDHPRPGIRLCRRPPMRSPRRRALAEPMPRLAQLVAASPLEAAIHDAYGKALGRRTRINLLGAGVRQHRSGRVPDAPSLPASTWTATRCGSPSRGCRSIISSALDPLTDGRHRPADRRRPARNARRVDRRRRPDALEDQARRRRPGLGRGARGFGRAGGGRGAGGPRLHGVVLLGRFQREVPRRRVRAWISWPRSASGPPQALGRLQYIEQPTHRDLPGRPEIACTAPHRSSRW